MTRVFPFMKQPKRCIYLLLTATILLAAGLEPALSANRSLSLYFTHTREKIDVVYKRNGRFVPSALRDLNRFLRDWRRNEATKMDPELFDLLWEVQQEFGGKRIHVVSAYRSPATNQMLRKRSRGVARRSQHMAGKAIDFFIKGANMSKVRQAGMRRQVGGVGYYPRSASAFVHFDTGRVRSWPRMPRGQLARLFPDGKTLHLPSNGKPLKGYKQAQALEKAGKLQKLRGRGGDRGGGGGNLLAGLLGNNRNNERVSPATVRDRNNDRIRNARVAARPRAAPEPEDRPVRVRTASVATDRVPVTQTRPAARTTQPETRPAPAQRSSDTASGEPQGIFQQLPGVSLGGLIDRFRGDDANAPDNSAPNRQSPAVTGVTPSAGDPIGEVISETPLPPPGSPRQRAPEPQPQQQDEPVVVAALPPVRPSLDTLLQGTTALGYVDPADDDAAVSAAEALAAQTLPPQAGGSDPAAPADPPFNTPSPEQAVAAVPATLPAPDTSDTARRPRRTAALATTLTPLRGASPALIATSNGVGGETFGELVAPNRNGDGVSQILLVGGFLGEPGKFSRNGPAWPNPDGFKGLRITLFASPRS